MFRFVELKKENGRRERKSGKRSSLDIWCREGRKSRFYPECFVSCDDSTTKESGRKKEKHSFFTAEYPTFMQRRKSGILSRMFRATMLVEWNGRKKTGGKSDEKRKTDIFGVKEKKRIEDFYFVSRKEESRSNERRGGGRWRWSEKNLFPLRSIGTLWKKTCSSTRSAIKCSNK